MKIICLTRPVSMMMLSMMLRTNVCFKDGADAVKEKALDVEQVRSVLLATKGFGAKRVADVCKALEESLDLKCIDGSGAE